MIANFKKVVLDNFTNFNGRARRREFWLFYLFNIIVVFSLSFLAGLLQIPELSYVVILYYIFMIIPYIAVLIRRMHDVGKSGWYCLIPIYNIVLACTNGEEGENEYGADPKGNGDEINDIGVTKY